MITIRETVHSTRLLEPHYVTYRIDTLKPERFEAVRFQPKRARHLQPFVAALYGTNQSPRDRMRHDYRWRQQKMPTGRYSEIGN
jgi:hypothetical protein